jgi:histidine triad (HIT) family protein
MTDCIFCRIVSGELPASVVRRDHDLIAFRDVAPAAPVHILICPTRHVASIAATGDEDGPLLAALVAAAREIAVELDLVADGYRLVFNTGEGAGQTVPHLHLHLLGGRALGWPPG